MRDCLFAIVALAGSRCARPRASGSSAAPPAPAPGARRSPERAFPPVVESVDVSVTSVDVVVTDSKGNRVPGLTAADFEIKQDGVAQKITNFYAVTGGKVLLEDGTTIDLGSKAQTDGGAPSELKAQYIFYVDNLNIQPMNRNRMFRRLKEFVPTVIGPERGRHGRHLQPVAQGAAPLHLRRQRHPRGHRADRARDGQAARPRSGEWRDALGPDRRREDLGCRDQRRARLRAVACATTCEFTIDAIKETLDSMAGVQGRKSLLYMSEGLPRPAGLELFEAIREKFQRHDGDDAAVRLRHEHEVRQDRPGRQRQRRHDLHARRLGPDDRRRDVGRHQDQQGRAHLRVHAAPEHAGPDPDDGRGDGRHGGGQHERLEVEPRRDRRGLLQLLLPGLPQRAGRPRIGRTRSKSA